MMINNISFKKWSIALFSVLYVHFCAAMPVPKDVSENYPELRNFFSLPYEERITRDSTVEKFTESLINYEFGASRGAKVQACAYLAWTSGADSRAALEGFADHENCETPSWIGGAALYALKIRKYKDSSTKEGMLAVLSYELSRSCNMYEKMFIANRLWCDYGKDALPVILEAAKEINTKGRDHQVDMVKQSYLYYLSYAEAPFLIREILSADWPESVEPSNEWVSVMVSITPRRSLESKYLSFYSIRRLEEKLSRISQ